MSKDASLFTKIAYCIVVLGAIVPFGITRSSWVAMATGSNLVGNIPYIGTILFILLGGYRIYVVARIPRTLAAFQATGFIALLRATGTFLLYVGAASSILGWIATPLMRASMTSHSESGAEFFVVGMAVALLGGLGVFGLILYELSRLRSFEKEASRGI